MDDDDDDVGALCLRKRTFPRSRSLFPGPLYPCRHGHDGASLSSLASELDTRRRKGESERERREKKLLDKCFRGKRRRKKALAHPRVLASLSSPCLTRRTPGAEGGSRRSRGAGERRRWSTMDGHQEGSECKCDALFPYSLRVFERRRDEGKEWSSSAVYRQRKTASEALRRGTEKKMSRQKTRREREPQKKRERENALFKSILFSVDFTQT